MSDKKQTQAAKPAETKPAPAAAAAAKPLVGVANPGKVSELRTTLEKCRSQIAAALPKGLLSAERLARCAMTEFQKNWFLWDCDAASIASCVIQAAQLGLEIGGVTGQSYMVPYKNNKRGITEAQFQVGYRGLIALAHRSGHVAGFYAHVVHHNDPVFEIELGSNPAIYHKPCRAGDPGAPVGVYAVLKFKEGAPDFEYMTWDQIERHMRDYSKGLDRSDSPWRTAPEEMAKKTVIRRLAKRCPMSVELQEGLEAEDGANRVAVMAAEAARSQQLGTRLGEALNNREQVILPPAGEGAAEAPPTTTADAPPPENGEAKKPEGDVDGLWEDPDKV